MIRLVQLIHPQHGRRVAVVEEAQLRLIADAASVYELDRAGLAALLRGLFTADGTIVHDGAQIVLHSCSKELLHQVQLLLLSFGIKSALEHNRKNELAAKAASAQLQQKLEQEQNLTNRLGFIKTLKKPGTK